MPTSPDGILEVTFDPARAAVVITVDGDAWEFPPTRITMWRQALGQARVPVRGVVQRRVEGGWWIGSDHEMPLDTMVTYTITGYDSGGEISTSSVAVSTAGAAWGLWLKAPGRGDLTVLATWHTRSEVTSQTIGGTYQVHGGPEVSSWSGTASDRVSIEVTAYDADQDAALGALLKAARVLLVQTGQPAELGDGSGSDWWFVETATQTNPSGLRSDKHPMRRRTLQLVRTTTPAGEGRVTTGQDYSNLQARYATYQDVLDEAATYQDVMTGGA